MKLTEVGKVIHRIYAFALRPPPSITSEEYHV